MELADFFAIDRLSQHDEEMLIESAMQMQQMMMLYESGIREIKTKLDILSDESRISGKPSPIDAIKSRIKSPVRIELQIRTMAMDFWASLEHQLRYKSDVEIPEHMSDDLKKCADVIAETDQEMQRIAKELKVL